MAQIFGFDLPPGLEDSFYKIFQFNDSIAQTSLVKKTAVPTRQKKIVWSNNSLFVRWQDLYNGLSSARHIAWEAYWVTLPFSDHGGGGGFPGSGYSAFIYANAPRYQLGQDLLLYPPVSNLIYNGDFALGADGWNSYLVSFLDGRAYFLNYDDWGFLGNTEDHLFDLVAGHTYRFSFDYDVFSDSVYGAIVKFSNANVLFDSGSLTGSGHFSYDYISVVDHTGIFIAFSPDVRGDCWIDNVSLIDVT